MTAISKQDEVSPDTSVRARFKKSFQDHEYADAYARGFLNSSIATQIKVLREQRKLTQQGLADIAKMKQPRIAVMEDVNYSSWSISTLWRLAYAFHLRLRVSFEEFGTLVQEVESIGRDTLQRRSLEDDPLFASPKALPSSAKDVPQSGQFTSNVATPLLDYIVGAQDLNVSFPKQLQNLPNGLPNTGYVALYAQAQR